jgi:hypothetical protein
MNFGLRERPLWNKNSMIVEIVTTSGAQMPDFDPGEDVLRFVDFYKPTGE